MRDKLHGYTPPAKTKPGDANKANPPSPYKSPAESRVPAESGMTPHELAACVVMSNASRRYQPEQWKAVKPAIGMIYDWADPATGKWGQCWLAPDGTWKQEPLGTQPVVLEFLKRRRRTS